MRRPGANETRSVSRNVLLLLKSRERPSDEAMNHSQEFIAFITFASSLSSLHGRKTSSRQHPLNLKGCRPERVFAGEVGGNFPFFFSGDVSQGSLHGAASLKVENDDFAA